MSDLHFWTNATGSVREVYLYTLMDSWAPIVSFVLFFMCLYLNEMKENLQMWFRFSEVFGERKLETEETRRDMGCFFFLYIFFLNLGSIKYSIEQKLLSQIF